MRERRHRHRGAAWPAQGRLWRTLPRLSPRSRWQQDLRAASAGLLSRAGVMQFDQMQRIGDFSLTWGESLRWDDRRQRLYFVDIAAEMLHWLDGAERHCKVSSSRLGRQDLCSERG